MNWQGAVGITVDEYNQRWNTILKKFGGSLNAPSGESPNGLNFSCVLPPIFVASPEPLTAEQREVIVRRAEARFGVSHPKS